jgi:hypothetical protein
MARSSPLAASRWCKRSDIALIGRTTRNSIVAAAAAMTNAS